MKKWFTIYFFFVAVSSTSVYSQVSSGDSLALVDLYDNTGGGTWTNSTNWKSANPVGLWFGVTVSNGRAIAVNLSGNNLTGTIPSSIGNLTNLTQLQLFSNQLSGGIPANIGNLINLTSLGLENNVLSGTVPSSISSLSILNSLTLSGNQLTDSIPVVFKNLLNLQQFDIRNNRFDVLPNLSGISTLNTLRAENNLFTFEDLESNTGIGTFTYTPQDSVGSYSSVTAAEGTILQLTVTVGGINNRYQWKKNGGVIPGATNASYQIDSVKINDAGTYTCDITNTAATALTLKRRTITVTVTGTAPGAPSALTAAAVSTSRITLTWTAGTGIFLRYRIYRSLSSGTGFVQIDSTSDNATTAYSNTSGLNSKSIYFYRVFTVGNFGVSAASNTASDTTFNTAPVRNLAISDTSLTEGFPKIFYKKLSFIFSDADDPALIYSTQANSSEILSTVSNDSLYLQGVFNFNGAAAVMVSGSDGVSSAADTFNVTLLADNQVPVISSVQQPASTPLNTAFNVSCTVTDNGSITGVRIFHKKGTAAAYDSVTMVASGSTYSAQIPGSAATMEGVALFIKATDNGGNAAYSDTSSVPVAFTQITSSISSSEYQAGIVTDRWRLISVPVNLNNKNLAQLFPSIGSSQWTAYNGAGTKITAILPGQAFWFFHKSGDNTLTADASEGVTNPPSGVQVTLSPGWNLVGTPFTAPISVALDPLQFSGPWAFSGTGTEAGGWSKVTSMKPFGGYAIWNKNLTATTLTFTPNGVSVGKVLSSQMEEFKLTMAATGTKNGLTYVDRSNGCTILHAANAGLYNDPEPQSPGNYISAYFTEDEKKLSSIYRNAGIEGQSIDLAVESSMDDITIHLKFDVEKIRSDWQMKIYDDAQNAFLPEDEPITVYLKRSGTIRYKILVGTAGYLNQATASFNELPTNFSLSQNYPNPFNPATKISYALAKRSRVTMSIYNILGQKVRTVLDRRDQEVGVHTLEWNGTDNIGRGVSSGIYLYRIQAESINGDIYTQTKKMLFVK
ncbi:immunoglobulin domain-containing protein [bacterium]|nr:immunoglobulin domain-containing protein [bacterium]